MYAATRTCRCAPELVDNMRLVGAAEKLVRRERVLRLSEKQKLDNLSGSDLKGYTGKSRDIHPVLLSTYTHIQFQTLEQEKPL